jgi:hypothetical protein
MEIKIGMLQRIYKKNIGNRVVRGYSNFTKSFDQTLIYIPECDSSLGIFIFLIGGEHPFLPCHVVCAPYRLSNLNHRMHKPTKQF